MKRRTHFPQAELLKGAVFAVIFGPVGSASASVMAPSVANFEGCSQDISMRKAAQREREQARLFKSTLIETILAVIYVVDVDKDRSGFANRSYFKIVGHDPELARQFENFVNERVHPDDIGRLRRRRRQLRDALEGTFPDMEFRLRGVDGNYRSLCVRETVFSPRPSGNAKELLGVLSDISERRAMEEILGAAAGIPVAVERRQLPVNVRARRGAVGYS